MSQEEKVDTLLSRSQVPIIDLAHCGTYEKPHRSVLNKAAQQLQRAFAEKGFAMLVNHGIQEEKLKYSYELLDEFCRLPEDIKEQYLRRGANNQGYVKPDQQKLGRTGELKHAFNICTTVEGDFDPVPGFREHMADLAAEFKRLTTFMLQAISVALELPYDYLLEKHSHMLEGQNENQTTLRLLYYPPLYPEDSRFDLIKSNQMYSYQRCAMDRLDCRIPEEGEDDEEVSNQHVTRCGPHCDYGTFTLLAQDLEGGLEVKLPGSEKWQRVGHLPGALFINTGELLALWTQERFPALPHRVIIPSQQYIRNRGRHSIAFFCHPDNCTPIIPVDIVKQTIAASQQTDSSSSTESIDKEKPRQRRSSLKIARTKIFNAYQHVQRRFSSTYASY